MDASACPGGCDVTVQTCATCVDCMGDPGSGVESDADYNIPCRTAGCGILDAIAEGVAILYNADGSSCDWDIPNSDIACY